MQTLKIVINKKRLERWKMEEKIRTNGHVTVCVPWIVEMQNLGVNIFIYLYFSFS
jgi:hypothetical protein